MCSSTISERGFGILQAMFVAFTGAVVALVVSKTVSDSSSMAQFVSAKLDREAIAQLVLLNTSCPQTFPSVPGCTDGSYVQLIAKSGTNNILVRADGTTVIGGYNVRARCVNQSASNNFGLDIRIAKLVSTAKAGDPQLDFSHNSAASFKVEPVSKIHQGWSHPKANLFALPSLAPCASSIGGITTNLSCLPGEVMIGMLPNGLPQCAPLPTPASTPSAGKAACFVATPVKLNCTTSGNKKSPQCPSNVCVPNIYGISGTPLSYSFCCPENATYGGTLSESCYAPGLLKGQNTCGWSGPGTILCCR